VAKPKKLPPAETPSQENQPRVKEPDTDMPGLTPWTVFQAALKAVPALKYALAVLGLVSAIAIIKGFGIDYRVAVFGTIIMLVLMVAIVVFAALTKVKSPQVRSAALVLMWSFLALTILSGALLFTSAFFDYPKPLTQLFGSSQVVVPPPPTPPPEPKLLVTMKEMIRAEEGPLVHQKMYSRTEKGIEEAARDVCEYLKRDCYLDDPKGSVRFQFPALRSARIAVQYDPPGRSYKLYYWIVSNNLAEKRHFTFDPDNQEPLWRLAEKSGSGRIYWHAERPGYVANTQSVKVGIEESVTMEFRPDFVNIAVVGEGDLDQVELLKKAIMDCSPLMGQPGSHRFNCFGQERIKYLEDIYNKQQADEKMALINEKSIHYKIQVANTQ
jgi:hypothetical protein